MSIDCVEFCRALADETRQQILTMLQGGERCVGDIVEAFEMTQPTISHHLSVLKQMRLMTARKQRKPVYCGRRFATARRSPNRFCRTVRR
jgi:ArsR family transcriptional regulator